MYQRRYSLANVNFGNVAALAADIDAGFGVGYAHALEIVEFNGSFIVDSYGFEAAAFFHEECGQENFSGIYAGSDVVVPCTFSTFGNAYQTGVAFGGEGDGSFAGGEADCPDAKGAYFGVELEGSGVGAVEAEIAAIGVLHGVSFAFGFDGDGVLDIAGEFAVGDGNVGEAEAAECGAFGDNGAELVVGYHYIFGTGSDGGGFNEDSFVYRRNNHFALEFEELGFGGILGELFGQVASEGTESGILIDGMAGSDVGDGGHAGIEAYSPYAVVRAVVGGVECLVSGFGTKHFSLCGLDGVATLYGSEFKGIGSVACKRGVAPAGRLVELM